MLKIHYVLAMTCAAWLVAEAAMRPAKVGAIVGSHSFLGSGDGGNLISRGVPRALRPAAPPRRMIEKNFWNVYSALDYFWNVCYTHGSRPRREAKPAQGFMRPDDPRG
jgi:hypothetical protein